MDLPELSKNEYDILRILWKNGRQSVREVHDAVQPIYHWAYTTTKTIMDRMTEKNLLSRESFHGVYLYRALISRPKGLARFVQFFADRILELDTATVVSMLSDNQTLTPEEIDELEEILETFQKKERS
ncbi:BlaI/MecI/CopY family transcriptional regulator [bacterium]|nr:BlaI/MecI/CopY family transcriptional regulator [bacterium]